MTPIGIRRLLIAAVAAVTAVTVGLSPMASAAPSATTGLYGAGDPTYDGVYRQSLAIAGLVATGNRPAPAAITWLLDQQCADGSFQAYRANLSAPCDASDPVNFTGPDTNSTATALMALTALDKSIRTSRAVATRVASAARKASTWLLRRQNSDGGWSWSPGGASDANSTGLVASSLLTGRTTVRSPANRKARLFLGRLSFSCAAGGGFPYQTGGKVDGSATAQGLVGIAGAVPVSGPRRLAAAAPCANTAKAKAASYLATQLAATGSLTSVFGTGPDITNTGWAILGLVSARQGRAAVAKATAALKAAAPAETRNEDGPVPGDLGLFLLVAEATGSTPTDFGGVDLVTTLTGSIRR